MGSVPENVTSWQQEPDVSESLAALKERLSEEALNGPDGRRKLLEAAQSLANSLETPGESVQRLAYLVRPRTQWSSVGTIKVQLTIIRSPSKQSSFKLASTLIYSTS